MSQEFDAKELQEKLLTLRSLQVKEELSKLNAAQLNQLSNTAKDKLNDLKTGDASFANEKEITNQRYLIEVFNARQIELAQKEYFKSDYLQLRNSGVTAEALSTANTQRNELSDRMRNLTDQQMANRVESGYGGQETPMSKVLSEINTRDIEIANGESISDADLKSILKEESVQLQSLKSMPDAKAEDLKSQTELVDKLHNISQQRELLADANNPAVKSSFAAHPEDNKIDDLMQKLAFIQSNGLSKASSEYRAAANELSDARREYKGHDPAIKLHGALIRDRELNAASSQLSYQTFYGSLTGADAFRNDVEIARIESQRMSNSAVISSIATPSSSQQIRIEALVSEIRQGQREDQTLEAVSDDDLAKIQKAEVAHLADLKNAPEPDPLEIKSQEALIDKIDHITRQRAYLADEKYPAFTTKFEHHPDDDKIKELKAVFENVPGGYYNGTEYQNALHALHHARTSYAGNDPAKKIHGALLKQMRYEYLERNMQAKLFSERTTSASEVRKLQTGLEELKIQRQANLSVIDSLVKEKDYKELAQREAAEAKLAASTAQNKTTAPVLPQQPVSSATATAAASATLADKAAQDRSELPKVDASVPGKPAQPTNASGVGNQSSRPSFEEQIKAQREQQRANNQASNLEAGNANATPSSADVERSQKLSEAMQANAQQREAAKLQADQQQALSTDPALKP